ncbi:unnamed protein product (macronuclear) [Paramecium tetraurelia]|uniref:TLDc domain-containing protein n=1 Tax=Paramecium tetraurelia TaxID=5888 RepID=A0BKB0_PARTE|nr:uncharacterized protein GSPATT00029608001 [Paramecium tetraurelia]CAK58977.1 unnamed protein product [Paramecium tetraurelia]|eukprot:XP_001426375.1 hypothetical protein (macronuclear) [Paramecium tetraurelia strain d4-2]
MIQKEGVVKECIKNEHKGYQILAVDLSEELNKENDQKKYYCVKCLIEKIGIKKIVLYEEAIKNNEILNEQLQKTNNQQTQEKLDYFTKLQTQFKLVEERFQKSIQSVFNYIESKLKATQQKIEKVPEPTILDDSIKLLQNCYEEDGKFVIPSPDLDLKKTYDFSQYMLKFRQLISNSEQIIEEETGIQTIELKQQINLLFDDKQKRTPAVNLICESHNMEIIMFNLNQTEFEQTNPFLCVECAQDLLIRGNNAIAKTISLIKAEEKWNEYIKDQSEKRSQRQSRLGSAIGFIKKLQEKYNYELNKMIQSLNDQLKQQPKYYEQLKKLKTTRLQNQDKQSLHEIVKILGQTDQQKRCEQISNQEDWQFFDNQKKVLEELIKENLLVENQMQWLQNFNACIYLEPQDYSDDCKDTSQNDLEILEFLKRSSIQDQYFSFFENSFNSLRKFEQEEQALKQKGKLENLTQLKQETESDSILLQQDLQAKLKSLMNVDELQTSKEQYEKLLLLENQYKKKITDLEFLNKKQKTEIENGLIQIEKLNNLLAQNKNQITQNKNQYLEQISELKQAYSFSELSWSTGDTRILLNDYAQKIYRKIEERTRRTIKKKYLIDSSYNCNQNTFSALMSRINKKSNLLMIFKSRTQYIFGGFSPCQCLISGSWQTDEQQQSFLFSQTHDEIYTQKDKSYTMLFCQSQIQYGYQDIIIMNDFQKGSSNLGYAYQFSQYGQAHAKNHLFGSPEPNIMQFEAIMLIFA